VIDLAVLENLIAGDAATCTVVEPYVDALSAIRAVRAR
jgi:hypothetical protein